MAGHLDRTAAENDRTAAFPFEVYRYLRDEGYYRLTIPECYGGNELSLYETVLVQERLARGDGSVALSAGWHLGFFLNLRTVRPWDEVKFEHLCREAVERGELLNLFVTEPSGNPGRGGRTRTIARKVEGGYVLNGRKSFCTLAPILERFTVYCSIEDEDVFGEFLVEKGPGVTVIDTWDTLGMRSSGSHDVALDEVFVADEALLGQFGDGLQRLGRDGGAALYHIPAVYMGIALAARDYALAFASDYRPAGLQMPISEVGHVRQKLGEIESSVRTARTILYAAAARWDEKALPLAELAEELQHAKLVVCNEAIRIVGLAMRIVGGRSLLRSNKLERLFRDVQCGLHNPPMDDQVFDSLARKALEEINL